jgi:putative membrane protein
MLLSDTDRERVNARVAQAERRVAAQVVTAVVAKADAYPELPWKAYALATALAMLAAAVSAAFHPGWTPLPDPRLLLVAVLGAGVAAAAVTVLVPRLARVLLSDVRAEGEVRQYAQALFLDRELFRTRTRTAVLLLVSQFERRVIVLPDRGIPAAIGEADWQAVVRAMTPALAAGRIADALIEGVGRVEALLAAHGMAQPTPGGDTLPDVIEGGPAR